MAQLSKPKYQTIKPLARGQCENQTRNKVKTKNLLRRKNVPHLHFTVVKFAILFNMTAAFNSWTVFHYEKRQKWCSFELLAVWGMAKKFFA